MLQSVHAHPYQPVAGVYNPVIGHIHIKRAVLDPLLPSLQLMCRSSHLQWQCQVIEIIKML